MIELFLLRYLQWDLILRASVISSIPVDQPTIAIAHDRVPINVLVVEVMLVSPQVELDGGDIVRLEFCKEMGRCWTGDDRLGYQ